MSWLPQMRLWRGITGTTSRYRATGSLSGATTLADCAAWLSWGDPWRGIFMDLEKRGLAECPRMEWQDTEGYWHFVETNAGGQVVMDATDNEGGRE